jgi:hypothetical protein
MNRLLPVSVFLALVSLACSLTSTTQPPPPAAPTVASVSPTSAPAEPTSSGEKAVLLFTIGMHIEPMGETAQGYTSGKGDYHQPQFFQRHVQDILTVMQIVEAHGGRMAVQAQSPFTTVAIESGNTILVDLATHGHEIALHFHEDAHLGKNSASLSAQEWCDVMKEEIGYITQASGVTRIRYWRAAATCIPACTKPPNARDWT